MDSVHTYGICKSVYLCEKKYRIKEAVEQRLGSTGHDKTFKCPSWEAEGHWKQMELTYHRRF